jgi:hypothetical protein
MALRNVLRIRLPFDIPLCASACLALVAWAAAARTLRIVRYDGVTVEVIVEGRGPAIVLLPSLGRDSEEFDPVAALKRLSTLTPIVETHPGAVTSPVLCG